MKYDINQLKEAVEKSTSIRQVLGFLSLSLAGGGNYKTIKALIKENNINCSHFTGQSYLKGKNHFWASKIPLEDIFNGCKYTSSNCLRKRLIKEGILERKCYNCSNTEWLGNPIPIELEHIDGDNTNNSRNNLTLLCPNCHAQTKTYRGKNKKRS